GWNFDERVSSRAALGLIDPRQYDGEGGATFGGRPGGDGAAHSGGQTVCEGKADAGADRAAAAVLLVEDASVEGNGVVLRREARTAVAYLDHSGLVERQGDRGSC